MVSQNKPTLPPADVRHFIEHLYGDGYAVDHIYKITKAAGETGELSSTPTRAEVRAYARLIAKDPGFEMAREEAREVMKARGVSSEARMWGWLFRLTADEQYYAKIKELYGEDENDEEE